MRLLVPAMLCFVAAKILVIGQSLSLPDILGAALALLLSGAVLKRYARIGVPSLAVLFLLLVVLTRVLPWHIATAQKTFQWMPFSSFLYGGTLQSSITNFAEKFYLYGAALMLLVAAGMKLRTAVILECALLFATSMLQIFMVDRSAEITDAVLALILGLTYALLQHSSKGGAATRASR
jgi:hypothetical protein